MGGDSLLAADLRFLGRNGGQDRYHSTHQLVIDSSPIIENSDTILTCVSGAGIVDWLKDGNIALPCPNVEKVAEDLEDDGPDESERR